jgi:RND superfamily putative drug exporter
VTARLVARARWAILGIWLVTLALAGLAALSLPHYLSGGGWYVPGSGSQTAVQLTEHGFAGRGSSDVTLVAQGAPKAARAAMAAVAKNPALHVISVSGARVSSAGDSARSTLGDTFTEQLGLGLDDGTARRVLPGIQAGLRFAGVRVALVSAAAFFGEVNTLSQHDLVLAELATMPLLAVILLLLYRSIAAAAVSFVAGVSAIVWTYGVLSLLARHFQISVFAENAASMIGLGVSVDYSLFVISRYRTERAALPGGEARDVRALAVALRTSGHTVLFSGLIVVCSMATLFIIDLDVLRSIALAIVLVVVFAVLASLLVLPAVLLLLGDRIDWGRIGRRTPSPSGRHSVAGTPGAPRWTALPRAVMRRPVVYLAGSIAVLAALAAPALHMRTFTPDVRILPASSAVRWGYDAIGTAFGPGAASPLVAVVPDTKRAVLAASVSSLPGVAGVETAGSNGRYGVVDVFARGTAASATAHSVLTEVRSAAGRLGGVVGGETAEGVDANAAISARLKLVAVCMLGLIFLLLLVTFRSLLIPLKAIVVNGLSVAATYGILALLFTRGGGYLQNFVPALLLAVLFSLSTDYEVFLLDRVRESFVVSGDNTAAVASGLASTAPLITGAAALMVAVFGGFGVIGLMPMRQLGVGLAIAVALDATIVRLIVVPAFMRLAGRWNWWFPGGWSFL